MHATGTAISAADYLSQLATFATAAGWTIDRNAVYSSGDYWLAVHKGSVYLSWYTPPAAGGVTLIRVMFGTGYNAAAGPQGQASSNFFGGNGGGLITPGAGPYTGHDFFGSTSGAYLHTVLQCAAGLYQHLHAGQLDAVGGAAPALYTTCSLWSSIPAGGGVSSFWDTVGFGGGGNNVPFSGSPSGSNQLEILCTVDGFLNVFSPTESQPTRAIGCVQQGGRGWLTMIRSPNTFNQLTPFIPLSIYLERASGNIFSYIGDVLDCRGCNMINFAPGEEVTIGADTWKIFPAVAKAPISQWNVNGAPPASGYFGYAFRENA